MKLQLVTAVAVLTAVGFAAPVKAQDTQPDESVMPVGQTQVSSDRILEACAQDRAASLPIPFSDISPDDWAFQAVMSMNYCGAYRGSIPPEKVKSLLQQQDSQPSHIQPPTEWEWWRF
ncbi:MAG: S-layer protein [Coleofasciculus sp. S288]|nr:S-layer protein [Coleofasciculus sp. S288]